MSMDDCWKSNLLAAACCHMLYLYYSKQARRAHMPSNVCQRVDTFAGEAAKPE